MQFLLFAALLLCCSGRILIRPSDRLLAGYDLRDFEHVNDMVDDQPVRAYRVLHPGDVAIDPNYEAESWRIENLTYAPAFSIDSPEEGAPRPWDALLLRMPSFVVDVGAGVGQFTLAAASLGANVVSFEPMSRYARKLSKAVQRNHFEERVTLFQNMVWRRKESIPVRLGEDGRIVSETAREGQYGIDYVNTISLDEMVKQDVDLMRINGGGEDAVISGARQLICERVVGKILMTGRSASSEQGTLEMLLFLRKVGYLVVSTPAPLEGDVADPHGDLLFTLQGKRAIC